jgi:hypothetical protein
MSVFKGSEYIKRMEEKYRESYIRTYPFFKSNYHQCIAFKDKSHENTVNSERYLSVQFISIPKSELSKFNYIKVGEKIDKLIKISKRQGFERVQFEAFP